MIHLPRNSKKTYLIIILSTIVVLLFSPCGLCGTKAEFDSFLTPYKNDIEYSSQILLVATERIFFLERQIVYPLEKRSGTWQLALKPMKAVIGRNGFAPSGEKREGDGRTPSGIFPLGHSFGYGKSINTKMPYRQALEDDIWVDDPDVSDYNRWTKKGKTHASSYELMKRDDELYKYGVVIEYNTDPVIKGHGSAIFFHVWDGAGKTTAGCVAVSEDNMIKILEWLDIQEKPLTIIGLDISKRKLF